MMADFKIKICGMRYLQNIQEVCKLAPDYIGLIFYPKSKRFVPDVEAGTIKKAIPPGIKKVGVFVNEVVPEIIRKINLFGLDLIQIHGNESPGYCSELSAIDLKIIKAFGVDEDFNFNVLSDYESSCNYFLFDTKSAGYGGTGKKFDWNLLKNYSNNIPVFLSGGIGPGDVGEILKIRDLNVHAIDINSKFEKEPAVKDVDLLAKFIQQISEK